MAQCYKCNIELVREKDANAEVIAAKRYSSEEHIISNFCGGQITSYELLCTKCNNDLGTELEGELSKQLLFHNLFNFKLDRGKQTDSYIVAYTTETRKEVLINRKLGWRHFKPSIKLSSDGEIEELICQTEKEAREVLTGLKRKHPSIDIEGNLKKMKWVNEFLPEKIDFNNRTIGGAKVYRAFAKIAVNFFLSKGGDKSLIKGVIDYVCIPGTTNLFSTFYYSFSPIHKLAEQEISHILYLKGDNRKRLLYCYIELFSTINFIVILNRDYDGQNFTDQYCYDIINNAEIPDKEIKLSLLFDLFERLRYKQYCDEYFIEVDEYIIEKTTRTLGILEAITPKEE